MLSPKPGPLSNGLMKLRSALRLRPTPEVHVRRFATGGGPGGKVCTLRPAPCALRPASLQSAASQKLCESSAQSESKAARSSGFRKRWHEAMRWPERGRRRPSISLLPCMPAFGRMALSIGTEQPHCDAGYMGYMWASIAVGTQQPPFWRACTSSPVPDAFICSQEAASRMRSECSSRGYFFLPTRIV